VAPVRGQQQQHRGQRRRERQRVERGHQHGDRDREGELLVERPGMPPIRTTGTNTAARISAMADDGPETSRIACSVRLARGQPPADVMLDAHDHDRIATTSDGEDEDRTATVC